MCDLYKDTLEIERRKYCSCLVLIFTIIYILSSIRTYYGNCGTVVSCANYCYPNGVRWKQQRWKQMPKTGRPFEGRRGHAQLPQFSEVPLSVENSLFQKRLFSVT